MRYQKIHSKIWHDEKFSTLSDDTKLFFLYLLTSPHSNSLGIYILPLPYAAADLNQPEKRLREQLQELLSKGFILYDENTKLVCVKKQLIHNPLENENQVKAAIKILYTLPKSPLFSCPLELLNKPFHKPLLEQLAKQLPEQYSEPKEKEREKEREKEIKNIVRSPDKPANAKLSDEEFINHLKNSPAYEHIDVDCELAKMQAWLLTPRGHGKKLTRGRIVNWLNRIEKHVDVKPQSQTDKTLDAIKKAGQLIKGGAYDV